MVFYYMVYLDFAELETSWFWNPKEWELTTQLNAQKCKLGIGLDPVKQGYAVFLHVSRYRCIGYVKDTYPTIIQFDAV